MYVDFDDVLNELRKSDSPAYTGSGIVMVYGDALDPKNLDVRFRHSGSFTYIERYDGLIWVTLGTWGGSFETDKIYISNSKGITGIFNNTDLFKYVNYIRTTSKRGGVDVGDQNTTLFLTGKDEDSILLSYPAGNFNKNVVTSIDTLMPAGTYTKTFTWEHPVCEFASFDGYVETPSKGRIVLTEALSGRIVWENMTLAEYQSTGGNSSIEAVRDVNGDIISYKTLGYLTVTVNPPCYLYQDSTYTLTLYVSEGNNKGDGIFPYFIINGRESVSKSIATKDFIDDQVLSAGCYSLPSITNNLNNTITLSDGTYAFYPTSTNKGKILKKIISGATYTLTDNTTNYIIADYNSGNPIIRVSNDVSEINQSSIIPIFTILLKGGLHTLNWDESAVGLPNKILNRLVKTEKFKYQNGLDLTIGANRKFNISYGKVFYGITSMSLDAVDSTTDQCRLFYHSGGVWTYSPVTKYNNGQYDNGTNLVFITPNRYAVNWIYRGVESQKHIYITLGGGDYKLDEAKMSQPPLEPFPILEHCILVGRIIVKYGSSTPITPFSFFLKYFAGSNTITNVDIDNTAVYANNTAAIAGGLNTGTIYRTSTGIVMVVY